MNQTKEHPPSTPVLPRHRHSISSNRKSKPSPLHLLLLAQNAASQKWTSIRYLNSRKKMLLAQDKFINSKRWWTKKSIRRPWSNLRVRKKKRSYLAIPSPKKGTKRSRRHLVPNAHACVMNPIMALFRASRLNFLFKRLKTTYLTS